MQGLCPQHPLQAAEDSPGLGKDSHAIFLSPGPPKAGGYDEAVAESLAENKSVSPLLRP